MQTLYVFEEMTRVVIMAITEESSWDCCNKAESLGFTNSTSGNSAEFPLLGGTYNLESEGLTIPRQINRFDHGIYTYC